MDVNVNPDFMCDSDYITNLMWILFMEDSTALLNCSASIPHLCLPVHGKCYKSSTFASDNKDN